MPDCLDNIIGLTALDCSCYEAKPEGWDVTNASETGYYVTDKQFGFPVLAKAYNTKDCGEGTIWALLENARSAAILSFRTDLAASVRNRYKDRFPGRVTIGQVQGSSTLLESNTYVGQILKPNLFRYGKFHITAIYLGLNTSGDYDVIIDSNERDYLDSGGFTAATTTITTVANKFVKETLASEIILPMYSDIRPDDILYRVYYEPAGARPLNNSFTCCGRKQSHEQYMTSCGFASDTLVDQDSGGNGAKGLVLEGFFECDTLDFLCEFDDFGGYDVKTIVGRTLQARAAANLGWQLIHSDKHNIHTMSPEAAQMEVDRLEQEYFNGINWITENLPKGVTTCLECKDKNKVRKVSIIV